jgi:hypothetical protein
MELWRYLIPDQIPTAEEINVYDSLDERNAVEHFLGKSISEAELLFRNHANFHAEDLMWMGPKAFNYYILAAIRYIRSSASLDDAFGVGGFLLAAKFQLEHCYQDIAESVPLIRDTVQYVLEHWDKFDFGSEYGQECRDRCSELQAMIECR